MALTPTAYTAESEPDAFIAAKQPSRTYRVNFDNKPSSGMLTGLEAVKQSIFCILSTERFVYEMFSFNYGVEVQATIGQVPDSWILGDLKDTITEALMQDDRIEAVYDFKYSVSGGNIVLAFRVDSTEGETEGGLVWYGAQQEVNVVV